MYNIESICVAGAGTMGSGIAQTAARYGFRVIQFDVNEAMLERSRASITAGLSFLVEKKKMTEDEKRAALESITFTTDLQACRADLVIEAIIEDLAAKVSLFRSLAVVNERAAIFATNTSSISVNAIADGLPDPAQLVGMHFFNPAPVMKLVEVIEGARTGAGVTEAIMAVCRKMEKTPVVCRDVPGFIVNRVARHYYLEAMRLLENGGITPAEIDVLMESAGFKMGPFKLMDLIGLDINYGVSRIVWEALGQPARLEPALIQQQKVERGELGRKTGKGFYEYNL